nr:MAG TPA: Baseplate wedge protein [Bacteriophage sp.]
MASSNNSLSYTNRDIVSIRKELINTIPKLTDKWTDFNESDLGITLIELMAGVQDMQNFYLDTQAFETYLDTAVQDKNVRALLRSMNYRIPLAKSSECKVRVVFVNNDSREITIPKYTSFTSSINSSVVNFVAKETITKSGSFDYIDIPVMEGIARTVTWSKDDLTSNKNVDGDVSRRIYLGYKNVSDGSVEIVQHGNIWKECDDALLKYEGGRWYSVHVDSDGQVYVLMSVNFLQLVEDGDSLDINFVATNGVKGIIDMDTIDTINLNIQDVQRIYNTTKSYDASDSPSSADLQNMKVLARRNAVTMGRYITLEDFETAVYEQSYVFQAVVKDWKYSDYVSEPYVVKVWAVNTLGESLGELTREKLKKELMSKAIADVTVQVLEVESIDFNIDVDVVLSVDNETAKERLRTEIISFLNTTYRAENMSFGENISYSLMTSRIKAYSPYIKDVVVRTPSKDIEVGNIQFPRLNKISVRVVEEL